MQARLSSTPKTRPGRCVYIWKIVGGKHAGLTKGATFRNRADSKAESLEALKAAWGALMDGGEPTLIKTI